MRRTSRLFALLTLRSGINVDQSVQSVCIPSLAIQRSEVPPAPRHSALVRLTHWIPAASFIALVLSGIGILLAYPRMHWGETGTLGTPSLFDLPLPFVLDLPLRGPGRYLHFLAAWVTLFTGLLYATSGLYTRHFRKNLLPKRSDLGLKPILKVVSNHLRLKRPTEEEAQHYAMTPVERNVGLPSVPQIWARSRLPNGGSGRKYIVGCFRN